MIKNSEHYIDYLDSLISDNYANYWKFEIERNDSLVDQYKANSYQSIIVVLENIKTFYVKNVEGLFTYESFQLFKKFLLTESEKYEIFSVEYYTINIILITVINLIEGK